MTNLTKLFRALLPTALLVAGSADLAGAQNSNPCRPDIATDPWSDPCQLRNGAYRAILPDGPGPYPALVHLYGSLGKSINYVDGQLTRQVRREIVERGYAFIVPAALPVVTYRSGQTGTGWGRRARRAHPRDDVAFVRAVILDAVRRLDVDPNRILLHGQSDGGFFIYELACFEPDIATAFAVHGASFGRGFPARCTRPVRFLHGHGVRDETVPFDRERRSSRGDVTAHDPSVARQLIARTNRCARGPEPAPPPARLERFTWTECFPGSALDFFAHRGGHGWPRDWFKIVIDWYETTEPRTARAVNRSVGAGRGTGFQSAPTAVTRGGSGGGRFQSAPN
ncbi:MAG: alpha/beta hydrolase family esterase [Paracoccaceae bacterium]